MTERDTQPAEYSQYAFFRFGLIVTGKTERQHLERLFKSLTRTGICNFKVIERVNQLGAITSPKRLAKRRKALRNGKDILDKADIIGSKARRHLKNNTCCFVLLIDDLEYANRDQARQVFDRYRSAFDKVLDELKHLASVHFLVNMLEAYYFADAQAINAVLGTRLSDYEGDVEEIHHPKHKLEGLYSNFDTIKHGGAILNEINIEHILSRPDTCASLRTLFAWCVKVLETYSGHDCTGFYDTYKLHDGKLSEITGTQLDNF